MNFTRVNTGLNVYLGEKNRQNNTPPIPHAAFRSFLRPSFLWGIFERFFERVRGYGGDIVGGYLLTISR